MKELSIEDKARAYDDVLERMRDFLKYWKDCGAVGAAMEKAKAVFPELAESEDERIRKEIIEQINLLKSATLSDLKDKQFSSWIAWLEKQGEQKHTDKVEPKFKQGDWIVFNGLTLCVKGVVKGYYITTSKGGITNSYDWNIDNAARLWNIQDANDGDVLYASPTESNKPFIFIFDHIDALGFIKSYYKYDSEYGLKEDKHLFIGSVRGKYLPATKEQCDLLLQKLKEAGKKIYNIHAE